MASVKTWKRRARKSRTARIRRVGDTKLNCLWGDAHKRRFLVYRYWRACSRDPDEILIRSRRGKKPLLNKVAGTETTIEKFRKMLAAIERPADTFQIFVALTQSAVTFCPQRGALESQVKGRRNSMQTFCPQTRREGPCATPPASLFDWIREISRAVFAKALLALN